MKLISFLVPAYNSEAYLDRCLLSLVGFGEDVEIIVVDDGSKDSTGEIADRYALEHSNVQVIHQENGGHGAGINAGLKVATGLYFKVIDSDDWVDQESCAKLLELIKNKVSLVFAVGVVRDKNDLAIAQRLKTLFYSVKHQTSNLKRQTSNISASRMHRLAARLAHGALGGRPCLGRHLHEREHRDASELRLAAGAVNEENDAGDLGARGLDEVNRLLDASALGDDIFGDHVTLALLERKAAHREDRVGLTRRIDALALHLFGEDALDVQLARDLVSDENAADRGRDDAVDALAELAALHGLTRHLAAELLGDTRIPEHVRALEVAVGMKFRAELEMALEQCARILESL